MKKNVALYKRFVCFWSILDTTLCRRNNDLSSYLWSSNSPFKVKCFVFDTCETLHTYDTYRWSIKFKRHLFKYL